MSATVSAKTYPVKLRQSLAGINWSAERGDVVDVTLADARRMVARGVAEEIKETPLPRATPEEIEAARVRDVETVAVIGGNSNRVSVRPIKAAH